MNKSLITNIVTLLIIALGLVVPMWQKQILSIGFFAFSGAITNWLAVHMLFEKVPFLYGSGVIQTQFKEFKIGIKNLIMTQFFTDENMDKFFQGQQQSTIAKMNFEPVVSAINYDDIFEGLLEAVEQSKFGGMLTMFGGMKALEPIREPFKKKMHQRVSQLTKSPEFLSALEENILPSHLSQDVIKKVEEIVDQRLEELTPQMVKEIIQDMIARHLGWLVVWGGVFGGLIGFIMSFVPIK
ncbi:FIG01058172: hypothetical protein [hydrothermal vent metagenome]|uniref:DUF445 domain-containing protein n=1 Tax=hydrothermal vent metagenome TaxID=652676 RepID=A0A3B1D411_9ZZZZ